MVDTVCAEDEPIREFTKSGMVFFDACVRDKSSSRFHEQEAVPVQEEERHEDEQAEPSTPWAQANNKKKRKADRRPEQRDQTQRRYGDDEGGFTVPGVTLLHALLRAGGKTSKLVLDGYVPRVAEVPSRN